MSPIVITYLVYLAITVTLTVWVAQTLFKNGRVFLVDVFHGDEKVADSVNHLLVVGFYLVNLGYVSLMLRLENDIAGPRESIEALSTKVGLVLLILGGMHFLNLFVFNKIRSARLQENWQNRFRGGLVGDLSGDTFPQPQQPR
ncbi:MAG TPA: hypothetical protein VM490_05765 [Armatimonadaceae bacterium]|nr:hypothetical protein [Armatimonadaceae bacterium]